MAAILDSEGLSYAACVARSWLSHLSNPNVNFFSFACLHMDGKGEMTACPPPRSKFWIFQFLVIFAKSHHRKENVGKGKRI